MLPYEGDVDNRLSTLAEALGLGPAFALDGDKTIERDRGDSTGHRRGGCLGCDRRVRPVGPACVP